MKVKIALAQVLFIPSQMSLASVQTHSLWAVRQCSPALTITFIRCCNSVGWDSTRGQFVAGISLHELVELQTKQGEDLGLCNRFKS